MQLNLLALVSLALEYSANFCRYPASMISGACEQNRNHVDPKMIANVFP